MGIQMSVLCSFNTSINNSGAYAPYISGGGEALGATLAMSSILSRTSGVALPHACSVSSIYFAMPIIFGDRINVCHTDCINAAVGIAGVERLDVGSPFRPLCDID